MIVDIFAGPGGWDHGLTLLGRRDVIGIEWDRAACATARAAGHARLRADVRAIDPHDFDGAEGLIASPPCQAWSSAGDRGGELDRANCHRLADRMAAGGDSTDWTGWEDERSALVCEPVRWVRELRPEWVALEEVPAVAGLWEHFARIYRGWGYSAWTGDLLSADYGVPQTRLRRILIASRVRRIAPPERTHAKDPAEDLFGGTTLPWVTLAEALGWGFDEGAVTQYRDSGPGAEREPRSASEPSYTIRAQGSGSHPSGVRWGYVNRPAPTPTPEWARERPATTVVGSFRPDVIAAPGYRTDVSRQNTPDSIRVTVEEAGVLQSFPRDYPWQGSRTKRYEQVGNAVPPVLAAHVLAAAMGRTLEAS